MSTNTINKPPYHRPREKQPLPWNTRIFNLSREIFNHAGRCSEQTYTLTPAFSPIEPKCALCVQFRNQFFALTQEEGPRQKFGPYPLLPFLPPDRTAPLFEVAKGIESVPAGYISHLFRLGTDPSTKDDFWGNTPLLWAIANALNGTALQILNTFGPGGYLNCQCKQKGNSALHLAMAKEHTIRDKEGRPLSCSNTYIAKTLIAYGANVNLQNLQKITPLHIACARRNPELIEALLRAGADPSLQTEEGKTADTILHQTLEDSIALIDAVTTNYQLFASPISPSNHADNLAACERLLNLRTTY